MSDSTLVGLKTNEAKRVLEDYGLKVRVLDWVETESLTTNEFGITTGDLGANRVTLIVQDDVVIDSYRG